MTSSYISFNNDKLILAMAEKQMTSKDISKKTGLSYHTVLNCVHEKNVNVTSAGKVAKVLKKKIEDLI